MTARRQQRILWAVWAVPLLLLPLLSVYWAAHFDTGVEQNAAYPALMTGGCFLLLHGGCGLLGLLTRRFAVWMISLLFALASGVWQMVCLLLYWSATPEPDRGHMGQGIAVMLDWLGVALLVVVYLAALLLTALARRKGRRMAWMCAAALLAAGLLLLCAGSWWMMAW